MNYYIDFEASDYLTEIISIGCVDETGRSFYRLIRPHRVDRITKFITQLTGITRDMARQANSLSVVAAEFNQWIGSYRDAKFFVYGNSDREMLRHELSQGYHKKDSNVKRLAYGILYDLTDYSQAVQEHYNLNARIRLINVYNYFAGTDKTQIHNALDDAQMLKYVFDRVPEDFPKENPFPEYAESAVQMPKHIILTHQSTRKRYVFDSISTAAHWLCENEPVLDEYKMVKKRLGRICRAGLDYAGYTAEIKILPFEAEK